MGFLMYRSILCIDTAKAQTAKETITETKEMLLLDPYGLPYHFCPYD